MRWSFVLFVRFQNHLSHIPFVQILYLSKKKDEHKFSDHPCSKCIIIHLASEVGPVQVQQVKVLVLDKYTGYWFSVRKYCNTLLLVTCTSTLVLGTCISTIVSRYVRIRSDCLRYEYSMITGHRTAAHSSYSTLFSQRFTALSTSVLISNICNNSLHSVNEICEKLWFHYDCLRNGKHSKTDTFYLYSSKTGL